MRRPCRLTGTGPPFRLPGRPHLPLVPLRFLFPAKLARGRRLPAGAERRGRGGRPEEPAKSCAAPRPAAPLLRAAEGRPPRPSWRAERCLSGRLSWEGPVAGAAFPAAGKVGAQEGRKGTLTSSCEREEADEGGHPGDAPPLPSPPPPGRPRLGAWGGVGLWARSGDLRLRPLKTSFWVGFVRFPCKLGSGEQLGKARFCRGLRTVISSSSCPAELKSPKERPARYFR